MAPLGLGLGLLILTEELLVLTEEQPQEGGVAGGAGEVQGRPALGRPHPAGGSVPEQHLDHLGG